MIRYVGPFVAVSLLTLTGCLTYPYGNYLGYGGYGGSGGYGGYPYNDYPYSSGAPYCPPSYGYSYDPYASQYGYGYGYSPGVVVPAPAPPVVVEDHSYAYDYSQDTSGRRWRRHHAGERFAHQGAQIDNSRALPGTLPHNPRLGPGSRTPGMQDSRAGAWQTNRSREQFTNRSMATQNRRYAAPNPGAPTGTSSDGAQMRRNPMLQQNRGPVAAPRLRQAPSAPASPRPTMAGATRSAPRIQASQTRQQAPSQTRGAARDGWFRGQ